MRDALRCGLVVGLILLAPSLATAQAAAGVDTKPPPTWSFGLSAEGSWYENPYFTSAPALSSWSTSAQATLSHRRRFRTGSFTLSGFGGALYYPEIDDLTQPTYGGALGLVWAPSPRTRFQLGQTYQRSNTRNLRALDIEGLPVPTSSLDNAATTLGFQQQLSKYWEFGVSGSFTWRRYDDERLTGGEQAYGSLQLGRMIGKRSSLYVSYGYSSSWFDEGKARSHQALLGLRRQVDRGVSLELAGGVGYVESTALWYPSARASLAARGRRSSLTLGYYRDFGQAFGYGRQMIGDLASASLGWTPARKLSLNAGYNFGYRRDPADEAYTVRSHVASAGFGLEIVKGLSFGGSYSWERNETEGAPVVEGQRAAASLSYGVDWR
jgi:hypothetical protein